MIVLVVVRRRQECSFKDWENLLVELSSTVATAVNDHQVNRQRQTDNRIATESDNVAEVDSVPKCKSGGHLATAVGIFSLSFSPIPDVHLC